MAPVHDPATLLGLRFRTAIAAAFPELGPAESIDPMVARSRQASLGDFQSNAAMALAKRLSRPPREVAAAIVERLDVSGIAEPVGKDAIAGPGFINVRLDGGALGELVASLDGEGTGVEPANPPQTVVVDLCGVNLAKQMHVGHLRPIIIGDAIARVFERLGHRVIRQNHVGDWGLPIAMVTARVARDAASGALDLAHVTLDTLDREYRAAQREADADTRGLEAAVRYGLGPKALAELEEQVEGARRAMDQAKRTLLNLQAHEPATVRVWQRIADVTMEECLSLCGRLRARIGPGDSAGESSYAAELAPLAEDLKQRGVAEESAGALVVRLDRPEDGSIAEPCIVRKGDGGFLYATTDLAAIRRRVQTLGADRVVYAVDARQSLHFRQVFAAARRAGYATRPGRDGPARLEHAAFGAILGEDGKPFKTRSGESVRLSDFIDEAVSIARRAVDERSPDLSEAERREVAEVLGVAAIKYADLATDRVKDYVFTFARMVSFEGNTGPYLLYALVRIRSIFRKAGGEAWRGAALTLEADAERALALELVRYPGVLSAAAEALEPHRVCQYLYDLAGAFSAFFEGCPVLRAETEALRRSRLRLCAITERVLADGLDVLGIPALERM